MPRHQEKSDSVKCTILTSNKCQLFQTITNSSAQ